MAGEAALPATALLEIFAFAHAPALVASPSDAFHQSHPSTAGLHTLALVCRAWRLAADEQLRRHLRCVTTLRFTAGGEDAEQREHAAALSVDGARVEDLRLAVAPRRSAQMLWWEALLDAPHAAGLLDAQPVDWRALLRLTPNVRRLDLSRVPLHHFALADALRAAAACCTQVEALVLPKRDASHADAVDATIDDTFAALYIALEKWHEAAQRRRNGGAVQPELTRARGLRQLTVPSHSVYDPETTSTRFLSAVARFCPELELLDGWKRSYRETSFVSSGRSLSVTKEVWTQFCARCTRLREFSWVLVPFADAFFEPFGATAKPQLTHLQLAYNAAAPFRIIRSEYSTEGLCALLRGCPSLRVLDVALHRTQSAQALVYPHLDEMIDGAVFDDLFIAQLARSCRLLERLRIRAVDKAYPMLNAISDQGICALAALKRLRFIELLGARCSASGIWSLAQALSTSRSLVSRVVKIRELGSLFGEIATELLENIRSATYSALLDCSKPLLLSIECRRGSVFQKSVLDAAYAQIKAKYSRLRFVALVAEKPTSREKDTYARRLLLTRASSDVARVGKLILYTDTRLLSAKIQAKLSAHDDVCVIQP